MVFNESKNDLKNVPQLHCGQRTRCVKNLFFSTVPNITVSDMTDYDVDMYVYFVDWFPGP